MSERSIHEITDPDDVTYEIKRARMSPASPTSSKPMEQNCSTAQINGNCETEAPRDVDINIPVVPNENECNGMENGSFMGSITPPAIPQSLPIVNPVMWVQQQMENGINPIAVLLNILPPNVVLPDGLSDITLWRIVIEILSDMPKRVKLPHINTLHDVITLLKSCRNIVVVSGAGISVSCGIPDFRSKDGIYSRLAVDYPDLPNPQAMFDIQYFSVNPKPFYKFASEIWPGKFTPSASHEFIKLLENAGSLLRNYTQNIDTLEKVCGIKKVVQCHGSFATATCRMCAHQVDSDSIKQDVMDQKIPMCTRCPNPTPQSIMKPDIVFFGEGLPSEFHQAIEEDRYMTDLVIVMGSSLKVKPVAHIPNLVPPDIPQILINREPLPHMNFDVELLGNCDIIVSELCSKLGWVLPNSCATINYDENMESTESLDCVRPARYLFPGAEVLDESSQVDSCSEEGIESESPSGVTTEDEDTNSDHYVTQMRYAMGCDSRTYSENPGPSGLSHMSRMPPCDQVYHNPHVLHEERWDSESVSNVSLAAQMGDSREPSIDSVSVGSLEDMDAHQT